MLTKIRQVFCQKNKKIQLYLLAATFAALFGILLFTRLYKITTIPIGVHHDELMYLIQAKFIQLTGKGFQDLAPHFQLKAFHQQYAELPALFIAWGLQLAEVFQAPFPVNYKLTNLLLALAVPLLLGYFAASFFKDKKLGWLTVLLAILNPWLWQISRMSFDPTFSIFFYLLGSIVMLRAKKWHKLVAIPLFFLGFYQYQGMKLLLMPLVFLLAVYNWLDSSQVKSGSSNSDSNKSILSKSISKQLVEKIKQHWPSLTLALFTLFLTCFYLVFQLPNQAAGVRVSKIVLLDPQYNQQLAQAVDQDRRLSLNHPTTKFFTNKLTATALNLTKKYLAFFDPIVFFIENQPSLSPFSVWKHGLFYLIDLPLILLGLWQLATKENITKEKRQKKWIYLALILASPLPYVLSTVNDWRMFRGTLFYLLLIPLIGLGIKALWQKKHQALRLGLIVFYLLSALNFSYQYFVAYPVYSSSGLYLESQLAIEYLVRHRQHYPQQKIKFVTDEPDYDFFQYLYSHQILSKDNAKQQQKQISQGIYQHFGVEFTDSDVTPQDFEADNLLIASIKKLEENQNSQLQIVSPLDSGAKLKIFNDQLCSQYDLSQFVDFDELVEADFKRLTDKEFCQTWIVKQN